MNCCSSRQDSLQQIRITSFKPLLLQLDSLVMAKRYVGYILIPHETRKQNIANRHHKPAHRSQLVKTQTQRNNIQFRDSAAVVFWVVFLTNVLSFGDVHMQSKSFNHSDNLLWISKARACFLYCSKRHETVGANRCKASSIIVSPCSHHHSQCERFLARQNKTIIETPSTKLKPEALNDKH